MPKTRGSGAAEVIRAHGLCKTFCAFSRCEGIACAVRNLFQCEYREVSAVAGIELSICEEIEEAIERAEYPYQYEVKL